MTSETNDSQVEMRGWAGEVELMETDAVYFRRRAREEREAALSAAHEGARQAHLDMARRYDRLAAGIGTGEVVLNAANSNPNLSGR
jgi:hypothetical protein